MAVDYDVVIIGGSPVGRYAAATAAQMGAAVALVEPHQEQGLVFNQLTPDALAQVGRVAQQVAAANQLGIHSGNYREVSVLWAETMQWFEIVASHLEEQNSLSVLASLGVDVIQGTGQFEQPQLFSTAERSLSARTYLIATGSRPAVPDIEGLQAMSYTAQNIWQLLTSSEVPNNWVIVGGDPSACQLAQTLTRLGLKVTLVVRRHILTQEDPDIALLVQAILEAEGVRVLTESPVTQVKQIQNKKWIQAGDEALETDVILLSVGLVPQIATLNLEAARVKYNSRLLLNDKLQTTNPRIYACGDVIGGYQFANIANYEAKIALKNALSCSALKVDYRSVPWAISLDPQLARVGLTEAQARRSYGDRVLVLRRYFKTLAAAQLSSATTGVCKLVVLRNGEILGASLVGSHAAELINVIALAISQRLRVGAIANLAAAYPGFSEIFDQLAAAWTQAKLTSNTRWQNFVEGCFDGLPIG